MAKAVEFLALSYGAEQGASATVAADEPALDLVHLSHQTLGDNELERELLTLFERQAAQFAARLAAPMGAGEEKWRADLVHTLKGSARAVGAIAVGRAADDYEDALRAGGPNTSVRLARLAASIETARRAIADLLERP